MFQLNRKPVPIGNSKDLIKGQELAGIGHSNGSPVPLTTGGYMISTYDMENGRIILSSAKFIVEIRLMILLFFGKINFGKILLPTFGVIPKNIVEDLLIIS